jgi:hypothetical protein
VAWIRCTTPDWNIVMNKEQSSHLKEKALSEVRELAIIVGYFWVLFTLFQLNKVTILREHNLLTAPTYTYGFALVEALIFGKIVLIAQALHFGEDLKDRAGIYVILYKSAAFSLLLLFFEILEKIIDGVFHGQTVADSIPALGGGGPRGMLMVGLMMFIILVPFFCFMEVSRAFGRDKLYALFFHR